MFSSTPILLEASSTLHSPPVPDKEQLQALARRHTGARSTSRVVMLWVGAWVTTTLETTRETQTTTETTTETATQTTTETTPPTTTGRRKPKLP